MTLKSSDSGDDRYEFPPYTEEELEAVEDFCNRPYWNRIWTVQERALAAELTVACGSTQVPWKHMQRLDWHSRRTFYNTQNRFNEMFRAAPALQAIWARSCDYTELIDLIFQHQRLEATDPRDKIYALLALVKPSAPIIVDYSKSTIDLYREVLRFTYPGGAETKGINPDVVAGILPAMLGLNPDDDNVQVIIKGYFPQGWSQTWDKVIAQHFR